MPVKLSISQVLERAVTLDSKDERIEALRQANQEYPAIQQILVGMFDVGVVWNLPPGVPPFNKNQNDNQETVLWSRLRLLEMFVKGSPRGDRMTNTQRERQFIQLLEAVTPDDAKLLIDMKDKRSPWRGLSHDVVRKAIPGLLPDVDSKPVPRQSTPAVNKNTRIPEGRVGRDPEPIYPEDAQLLSKTSVMDLPYNAAQRGVAQSQHLTTDFDPSVIHDSAEAANLARHTPGAPVVIGQTGHATVDYDPSQVYDNPDEADRGVVAARVIPSEKK